MWGIKWEQKIRDLDILWRGGSKNVRYDEEGKIDWQDAALGRIR